MKQKIITDIRFLKQTSQDASPDEVADIVSDLEDSLDLNRGLGLSAIQIGINKRISIVRFNDVKIDLINAEIIEKEEKFIFKREGCLSIPGIYIDTDRYNYVKILNNNKIEEYRGLIGVCVAHEIDHQNGITILQRKHKAR